MRALDLLATVRQVAFWRALGLKRSELQSWPGGVLPAPMSVERWEEIFPGHIADVHQRLDAEPGR